MPQAASLLPQTAPDCATPRVVLAYNPVAGGFSAGLLERLRGAFAAAGYVVEATGERTIEPALAERTDVVCIVGGDGTARTIVEHNRKLAGRAQICIYPAGTVNLIARERRSPPDPAAFVAHLAPARTNSPNRHHTGRITLADGQSRAFLCCASVGPDAEVVARVSPALKRRLGRWAYVAAMA
ncbi:MAG TPA: diacylglycerol kinase family protein, partial [Novosphingobium sp.]|nr:diacylglycerol kinase family protein [Novosphingobium sp.]